MIIPENTAGYYEISITVGDITPEPLDIAMVDTIEFSIGPLKKYFYSGKESEIEYDAEVKNFILFFTQEDTQQFDSYYQVPMQFRIKFIDGIVEASAIYYINIRNALSHEVI